MLRHILRLVLVIALLSACSGSSAPTEPEDVGPVLDAAALDQEAGSTLIDGGKPVQPEAQVEASAEHDATANDATAKEAQGFVLDCSKVVAQAALQLCKNTTSTCEVVFENAQGCAALCASAGLSCVESYDDISGQCAADLSKPLGCAATGHKSDYCVCGTQVCSPNCTNKSCGEDGCGGTCGVCETGSPCENGQCQGLAPVTVWLAGDSTVASGTGWGDSLQPLLKAKAKVKNRAKGGRSSKSFYEESNNNWSQNKDSVMKNIVKGDYVLIQFGHNDEKEDQALHTEPGSAPEYQGTFREYLERYINDTRGAEATPVLITSVSRMYFKSDGTCSRTHGQYPAAMKKTAADNGVVLLDLEEASYQEFNSLGEAKTLELFSNGTDRTHFPPDKAWRVAEMVATLLEDSDSPLAAYLK